MIAIAGDVESSLIDSEALEELNPYTFFAPAALYIGRLVNPAQVHAVVGSAITERGPTVISVPGDVASAEAPPGPYHVPLPAPTTGPASAADLDAMAALINQGETVAIFGGDGCRDAQEETRSLARKLKAPVGYTFKGKQWLEHDNPNAVGMTGLLGYGGCWDAINHAEVLVMLGTDFPFSEFLPHKDVKTIQVDRDSAHLGRREVRRQLDQDRFELLAELQRAGGERIDQRARLEQPPLVRDLARRLEGEGETVRHLRRPFAHAIGRRCSVHRRVDLEAAELFRVLAQIVARARSGVVHRTNPVRVRPALRPEREVRQAQPFRALSPSSMMTDVIGSPARIWSTTFCPSTT